MGNSFIILSLGLVLLSIGAEIFVRGSSKLARLVGVSPLIVGLTVVAFGTSAPELAVSLQSVAAGKGEMALGNVVGSNIVNVLLILGLSAALTPLIVSQQLVWLDVPILIGLSILVLILGFDGVLGGEDGVLLVIVGLVYVGFLVVQSRKESESVQEVYRKEYGRVSQGTLKEWLFQVGGVVAGALLLVWGSRWFVFGATDMALIFGMSDLSHWLDDFGGRNLFARDRHLGHCQCAGRARYCGGKYRGK